MVCTWPRREEKRREGFEAKKEVGVSWRVGLRRHFLVDEEDKLYTDTNIYQCSGPDFRLRLKRPRGGYGIARPVVRRSSRPKTRRRPMDHGGRHAREVGDAPVPAMRPFSPLAFLPRYNKSVQSSNAPTMCRLDKKYARTQRAFTLASSVGTPRRQLINLPLHIPEPLSMTRAAISSSSAMVAVGSFVGQVLLSLWAGSRQQVFALSY